MHPRPRSPVESASGACAAFVSYSGEFQMSLGRECPRPPPAEVRWMGKRGGGGEKAVSDLAMCDLTQSRFAPGVDIVEHGQEYHCGLDHVLIVLAQVHQGHAVVNGGHHQAADDNSKDSTDTT